MLLKVKNLEKTYIDRIKKTKNKVLDGVSLELEKGKTLGILGESGSGKSSLAHILVGQIDKDSGQVFYKSREIDSPYKGDIRRNIQMIYQHPEVSFNPKKTLYKSLKEPYDIYNLDFTDERLLSHLGRFGIYEEHIKRYPDQLSGGELQRASLARALIIEPEILILDEATSMLDVITQAQVLNILKEIQKEKSTSFIFITHDEKLCEMVSDDIYHIENGRMRKI